MSLFFSAKILKIFVIACGMCSKNTHSARYHDILDNNTVKGGEGWMKGQSSPSPLELPVFIGIPSDLMKGEGYLIQTLGLS